MAGTRVVFIFLIGCLFRIPEFDRLLHGVQAGFLVLSVLLEKLPLSFSFPFRKNRVPVLAVRARIAIENGSLRRAKPRRRFEVGRPLQRRVRIAHRFFADCIDSFQNRLHLRRDVRSLHGNRDGLRFLRRSRKRHHAAEQKHRQQDRKDFYAVFLFHNESPLSLRVYLPKHTIPQGGSRCQASLQN